MNSLSYDSFTAFVPSGFILEVGAMIVMLALFLIKRPSLSKKHAGEVNSKREKVAEHAQQHTQLANAAPFRANLHDKAKLSECLKQEARNGDLKTAMQIFEELEGRFPSLLSAADYNSVIVGVARSGDPFKAHVWLQRCIHAGIRPMTGTFNAVIHAYAVNRAFKQAFGVTHEMGSVGVKFNTVTYNTIIDLWRRQGDTANAQAWMKKLLSDEVQPNVVSFGTVMLACAQDGLLDELEEWYSISQKHKFQFDAKTLSGVVSALARRSDVVNSIRWLRIMAEHGAQPTIRCCAEVLAPITSSGDMKFADVLIKHMQAAGVKPDSGFFSQCIVMACKKGFDTRAQSWAEECVASEGALTWAARQALIQAGLPFPDRFSGRVLANRPLPADGDGEGEFKSAVLDAQAIVDDNSMCDEIEAARKAAIGKRFSGVVKDFVPGKFGYITCLAIFKLFHKDVFLGRYDNPKLLTKGHRVSFTLRVDESCGLPRASEVETSD